jgi:hypothetical protein
MLINTLRIKLLGHEKSTTAIKCWDYNINLQWKTSQEQHQENMGDIRL